MRLARRRKEIMRKLINLLILVATILILGCSSKNSNPTGGNAVIKDAAYIYHSDSSWAADFGNLLRAHSFRVRLIEMDSLDTVNLAPYSLIMIDSRTGYRGTWGDSAAVAVVKNSGKPILGLGFGGANVMECLGMSINWSSCWNNQDTNSTSDSNIKMHIVNPSHTIFHGPMHIQISADSVVQLYWNTGFVAVYSLSTLLSDSVIFLGREYGNIDHYTLVREGTSHYLWGFTNSPGAMTAAGKAIFVNLVKYMSNL